MALAVNSGDMRQQLLLSKVLRELYAMQDSRPKTLDKLRKRLDGRVLVVEYCDPVEILDMLVKFHDFDAKVMVTHIHEHLVPKEYMGVLGKELWKAASKQRAQGNVPVLAPANADMLKDAKALLSVVEFKDGFDHKKLTEQLVEICTRQPTGTDERVTKVFNNLVSTGYIALDEETKEIKCKVPSAFMAKLFDLMIRQYVMQVTGKRTPYPQPQFLYGIDGAAFPQWKETIKDTNRWLKTVQEAMENIKEDGNELEDAIGALHGDLDEEECMDTSSKGSDMEELMNRCPVQDYHAASYSYDDDGEMKGHEPTKIEDVHIVSEFLMPDSMAVLMKLATLENTPQTSNDLLNMIKNDCNLWYATPTMMLLCALQEKKKRKVPPRKQGMRCPNDRKKNTRPMTMRSKRTSRKRKPKPPFLGIKLGKYNKFLTIDCTPDMIFLAKRKQVAEVDEGPSKRMTKKKEAKVWFGKDHGAKAEVTHFYAKALKALKLTAQKQGCQIVPGDCKMRVHCMEQIQSLLNEEQEKVKSLRDFSNEVEATRAGAPPALNLNDFYQKVISITQRVRKLDTEDVLAMLKEWKYISVDDAGVLQYTLPSNAIKYTAQNVKKFWMNLNGSKDKYISKYIEGYMNYRSWD